MKKILSHNNRLTILLGDVVKRTPGRLVWPLSRFVGRVLYLAMPRRRRAVKRAYGVLCKKAGLMRSPEELTKAFFERQLMEAVAAYAFRGQPASRFADLCEIVGLDEVKEVAARGQGVLVLSLHFGTHLLSLVKLEQEGVKVTTVRPEYMKEIKSQKRRAMLFTDRETIYVGEGEGLASPVRAVVKKLREGYVVGFAPDGDQGRSMVGLPLFDGEYPIRGGVAEIVRLARCPVVYAQGVIRNGKYYIWYSPVMMPPINGDVENFTRELLDFVARRFQEFIVEYPECIWWTKPMEMALGLRGAKVV